MVLVGVGGQRHVPATLPPGKIAPVPTVEAGRASGPVRMCKEKRKYLSPIGLRTPDRPASSESLYTDYTLPAPALIN